MKHYTPEQIRNAEEILFNAEQTARLALVDAAYQIEQLSKRLEAAESLLRAVREVADSRKDPSPPTLGRYIVCIIDGEPIMAALAGEEK